MLKLQYIVVKIYLKTVRAIDKLISHVINVEVNSIFFSVLRRDIWEISELKQSRETVARVAAGM